MGITKIYFGEFAGLQLAHRDTQNGHRIVVHNVRGVMNTESMPAVALPLTPDIARILDTLRIGDPLIFRLRKTSVNAKVVLDCLYALPYWYETVELSQWEMILNELQTPKK